MKKTVIKIMALLPVLAACAVEPLPSNPGTTVPETESAFSEIRASLEQAADPAAHPTRTTLTADFKVNWASGNAISIFDGTSNAKFTTTSTSSAAAFTLASGSLETVSDYYALYPYSADASLAGSTVTTVLPNYQTGVKDGFDPKAALMVGKCSDGSRSFAMKNVTALVKVTIPSGVTSVTLGTNGDQKISGNVTITVGDGGVPSSVTAESSTVLLVPSGETFEAGDYFIPIIPCTASTGLYVVMTKSASDNLWTKSAATSCTFYRAEVKNLGDLGALTSEELMTKVSVTFTDGSAYTAPFYLSPDLSSKEASPSYSGIPMIFYSKEAYGSFMYPAYSVNGFTKNSTGGVRISRDPDDYFEFPAINGCRLRMVRINLGGGGAVGQSLTDQSGNIVPGGTTFRLSWGAGKDLWYCNQFSSEYTPYRMTAQEPSNGSRWFAIRQFDLLYSGTPTTTIAYVKTDDPVIVGSDVTLNGSVGMYNGSVSSITCGFEYKVAPAAAEWTNVDVETPAASFSKVLELPAGACYRAWAQVGGYKMYGLEKSVGSTQILNVHLGGADVPNTSGQLLYDLNAPAGEQVTREFVAGKNFTMWSKQGVSKGSADGKIRGLRMSRDANSTHCWMQFPAISGYKLVSVTWKTENLAPSYGWDIVSGITPDGNEPPADYTIAGGATNFGSMDFSSTTIQTVVLTGSEANVGYYAFAPGTIAKTAYLQDISLVYEAVE